MFVKYWFYNGYINIDNEKMLKLLGNFVFVYDIIKQYDLQFLRFFMFFVYYCYLINYLEEFLENIKSVFNCLKMVYSNFQYCLNSSMNLMEDDD